MKLPAVFDRLTKKAPPSPERFLSLVLSEGYVQSAVWSAGPRGRPTVDKSNTQRVAENSWEARIEAGDRTLTALDDDGSVGSLHSVVLGLSSTYLTETGDILPDIRKEVKNVCKELDLTAIGFVSLPQALMNKLKMDEGVPPTVILLSVSDGMVTVSLYKVGVLAGQETIDAGDIVPQLETTLKEWKDIEVLPSRILLFGTDPVKLEEIKHVLLAHPWPTRVSFLHFPKIDVLPETFAVEAVSLAGATEMAIEIGEEEVESQKSKVKSEENQETEENVVVVAPEELGFAKGKDVLEKKIVLPKVVIPSIPFDRAREVFSTIHLPIRGLPIIGLIVVLILLLGLYLWFIPHASVTILTLPKALEKSTTLIVDPTGTAADAETKTIPGKNQEKVVSADKTIPVAGKKDIGDPAKGTVIIYNKSLAERTFKAGSVLVAKGLSFTLDSDVKVASATESFTQRVYGKANGAVTAVKLGSEGNIAADAEFTFKDISTEIVVARNDQPFTGGTSKEVTVVSRADYDALVKAATGDLVEKAKVELATGVGGREKLIDATIKSQVSEKTFQEELDQEASVLHGKVTVTVMGVSYNEEDVTALFKDLTSGEIPSGYALVPEQTTMNVSKATVKKDGSISLAATIKGAALPTLNSKDVSGALAGKTMKKAEEYLRTVAGVSGMEVSFRWWPTTGRLPLNKNNISVSIALQE